MAQFREMVSVYWPIVFVRGKKKHPSIRDLSVPHTTTSFMKPPYRPRLPRSLFLFPFPILVSRPHPRFFHGKQGKTPGSRTVIVSEKAGFSTKQSSEDRFFLFGLSSFYSHFSSVKFHCVNVLEANVAHVIWYSLFWTS